MALPEHWGRMDSPTAHGVRAQFVLAALLAALAPVILTGHPIQAHGVRFDFGRPAPDLARYHRLELWPDGVMRIDGEEVDSVELRRRLDLIATTSGDWVDFRPDPNARYERVVMVLMITKHAYLDRIRFDNRAYRNAID